MLGSPSVSAAQDASLGRAAWGEPRHPPLMAWAYGTGAHLWGLQIPDMSLGWEREQEGSRAEAQVATRQGSEGGPAVFWGLLVVRKPGTLGPHG